MTRKHADWTRLLLKKISEIVSEKKALNLRCSIALTGGESAEKLYRAWAASPEFLTSLEDVDFFWGDERCVPPDHPESNYRLVAYTLFANGIPNGAQIYRMEANSLNLTIAASRYATLLPASIDIILLSMGSDGHIASLFAGSPAVRESRRRVLLVNGPRAPYQRLTLTPPVIKGAQHVFVIALGEEKRTMYEEARRDPSDVDRIPARLVLNRNWVFDVTRPNSQRL